MSLFSYIIWNPDSTIADLGFISLRWYSLFFALGFILSYIILRRYFKKEGVGEDKLEKLTVYIVVSAVIGMRLGHCLFYDWDYYSHHLAEILLPVRFEPHFEIVGFEGLASHGGAIGILIAMILYSRKYHFGIWWILDKLALVVPLAGCCIRLGNLMNSEIVGRPADVPWAFIFPQVDLLPRHPSQLYEAFSYLAIFIFINLLYRKNRKQQGFIFGVFLILLFGARFFIEFLKADQSAFEAGMLLNMGQILSIPFVLLGIFLVVKKRQRIMI